MYKTNDKNENKEVRFNQMWLFKCLGIAPTHWTSVELKYSVWSFLTQSYCFLKLGDKTKKVTTLMIQFLHKFGKMYQSEKNKK